MDTLDIVVVAVVAFFVLLALGGAVVLRRRREAGEAAFHAETERANRDLATAHAADNGWEPARVGQAARRAFETERPGAEISELELVQVIDPPGIQDDKAVYRVRTAQDAHLRLTLKRSGEDWVLDSLE